MLTRQNNSNIGNYRNESVISGTIFFHNPGFSIVFNRSSFIAMYLHPGKTEMDLREKSEKNKVTEITALLRYWPILEIIGGKA